MRRIQKLYIFGLGAFLTDWQNRALPIMVFIIEK